MFTRSDRTAPTDAAPGVGASIFLPTHVRDGESRRPEPDPAHTPAAEARDALPAAGPRRV